jgi:hypothetical protein
MVVSVIAWFTDASGHRDGTAQAAAVIETGVPAGTSNGEITRNDAAPEPQSMVRSGSVGNVVVDVPIAVSTSPTADEIIPMPRARPKIARRVAKCAIEPLPLQPGAILSQGLQSRNCGRNAG